MSVAGRQGRPCSQACCPSQLPTPLRMHKSPRLQGPQDSGPFSPLRKFLRFPQHGQLPAAARATGGPVTSLPEPGWPQPSSTRFHVAAEGKPKPMFTWPWPHTCVSLLETQKDPRPHAKELDSKPAPPLVSRRGHHLYETWFSFL